MEIRLDVKKILTVIFHHDSLMEFELSLCFRLSEIKEALLFSLENASFINA